MSTSADPSSADDDAATPIVDAAPFVDSALVVEDTSVADADADSDADADAELVEVDAEVDAGPPPPRCGDGVVDPGEACDTGEARSDHEPNACRLDCSAASCGDGVVDEGEGCDTGRQMLSDVAANACRSTCATPRCGDRVVDNGESCDDGDTDDGNACRNDCSVASCGDGRVDGGEQCDDANRVSGDGCQSTCLLPVCGDGVVDAGEACDDGNMFENDGCRSNCETGCTSGATCSDDVFCNGAEQCVAGVCQPGTPPALEDALACTNDACDEANDQVVHTPSDALCAASPSTCVGGALTSHAASCGVAGCTETARTSMCPDQASVCSQGAGLDMVLTTFAPACAGAGCGSPAASTTACTAPPSACSGRVHTSFRATCDAASESCGSMVNTTNDCGALDARSCNNGAHQVTTGRCTLEGCDSATTSTVCPSGGDVCTDGVMRFLSATCDPATGCGLGTMSPSTSCGNNAPSCTDVNGVLSYTTYTPACLNGTSCLFGGRPSSTVCGAAQTSYRCSRNREVASGAICDVRGGCGTSTSERDCSANRPSCTAVVGTPNIRHTAYTASCDARGARCVEGGERTDTLCVGGETRCAVDGSAALEVSSAVCDPIRGCSATWERRACPVVRGACVGNNVWENRVEACVRGACSYRVVSTDWCIR